MKAVAAWLRAGATAAAVSVAVALATPVPAAAVAHSRAKPAAESRAPRPVSFKTDDGWLISATYAPAARGKPTAIMVHGVAAGRGEYDAFASSLQARGWGTLALDLRGHGQSTDYRGKTRTFEDFDKTGEWPQAVFDVLAAAQFLEKQGVKERQVALIGGSIGANLCAKVFTALPHARVLVLLSPGAEYRGVRLMLTDGPRTVAAASPGDQYAYITVHSLARQDKGVTVLTAKAGHGAQMFADPDFVRALLKRLGAP